MGSNTKIEWVKNEDGTQGETWNVSMGCTPISSGCKNCYARALMKRFAGSKGWPDSPDTVTLYPERLEQPFRWRKPRRVFVNSMSDLFHDDTPFEFIAAVFGVMASTPQHTYMILTKRHKRMLKWSESVNENGAAKERIYYCAGREAFPEGHEGISLMLSSSFKVCDKWPLPNVHLGVSCEDQPTADERIPLLLRTPAAKRFISIEPCLSGIDVSPYLACQSCGYTKRDMQIHGDHSLCKNPTPIIDQIIVGSETGPGARPMDLDWARSIRDQCVAANVPFFFKKSSDGNRELDGKMWEGMIV